MKTLVTGAAGFIGMHTCKALLEQKKHVVGIDNINNYYDIKLKKRRLNELKKYKNFKFYKSDLRDSKRMHNLFKKYKFKYVINLAAQAGVRYSILNPQSYVDNNITGFLNILENCKIFKVKHLIYASSSSVYGANKKIPFSETDGVNHPISFYAATKRSNELMAHCYSHLHNLPTTGLRFFTVYGPWGRPDMAMYMFAKAIKNKKKININNYGKMYRDFTFIDDIVKGITSLYTKVPKKSKGMRNKNMSADSSEAPFKIYNIGNNKTVKLMDIVKFYEKNFQEKVKKNFRGMQQGDVEKTYANINSLKKISNFKPNTKIEKGLKKFIDWFNDYE
tara:strand:- start:57 stop:1058 length:1002 start_codon:yes stop_codon:yes gene_type:complete